MPAHRDPFNPLSPRNIESNDKALDGTDYTVYHVYFETGLWVGQDRIGFVIAGPSSLPDPAELWQGFRTHLDQPTGADVSTFVEFLRRQGYVQIQNSIQLGLRY